MIFKVSILFILITGYVTAQEKNSEIKIIAKGYYVQKLNDEPFLWILSHKKDTLKLYTNKIDLVKSFPNPKNIISIEVLKDKKAKDKFGKFGENGVININFKKINWNEIYGSKKHLNSKSIAVQVSKTKDTIYLKEVLCDQAYSKQVFLEKNILKIRKNGLIHKVNDVELFLCFNEEIANPNKIKINEEEIKTIIKPTISFKSHSKGHYQLIFDLDLNKILWKAVISKYNKESNSNGKLFTNQNGLTTIETIEIDAMNGKLITRNINDNVKIYIR